MALLGRLGGVDDRLDLVGVDEAGDVGVGHHGAGHLGASLGLRGGLEGPEDRVHLLHGGLGVDGEAAKVAAGGQLQQVEPLDARELDAGEVAEGLGDALVLGVDDEGPLAADVAAVPHLTLALAQVDGVAGLVGVGLGADGSQGGEGLAGLLDALGVVGDHEGHLGDLSKRQGEATR